MVSTPYVNLTATTVDTLLRPATRVIIERLQFIWKTQKDQGSEITQIMVDQNEPMNPCPEWIHRFI